MVHLHVARYTIDLESFIDEKFAVKVKSKILTRDIFTTNNKTVD